MNRRANAACLPQAAVGRARAAPRCQRSSACRYSNTLQEQQRFKAAANELLQGARPDGQARPATCAAAARSPRAPGATAPAAASPPCQRQRSRELEKALVAATATASELAHKVQVGRSFRAPALARGPRPAPGCPPGGVTAAPGAQGASLELANGTGSAASVQHAGKAAELLQARFSQVLGQAGAHPPAERTVAGAISSLDELSASLQLRDQARAGSPLHVEGAAARGPGHAERRRRRRSCGGAGRARWCTQSARRRARGRPTPLTSSWRFARDCESLRRSSIVQQVVQSPPAGPALYMLSAVGLVRCWSGHRCQVATGL